MSGSRQKRSEGRREQTNKSNAATELPDYSTRWGIDTALRRNSYYVVLRVVHVGTMRSVQHVPCAINGIFRVTSCMRRTYHYYMYVPLLRTTTVLHVRTVGLQYM